MDLGFLISDFRILILAFTLVWWYLFFPPAFWQLAST